MIVVRGDGTYTTPQGTISVASTDDTLDPTTATAADFPFDLSGANASADIIMVEEYISEALYEFMDSLIEDYRLYKTIVRPYIVETYRRFSKPFWRGKNFKKRIK